MNTSNRINPTYTITVSPIYSVSSFFEYRVTCPSDELIDIIVDHSHWPRTVISIGFMAISIRLVWRMIYNP